VVVDYVILVSAAESDSVTVSSVADINAAMAGIQANTTAFMAAFDSALTSLGVAVDMSDVTLAVDYTDEAEDGGDSSDDDESFEDLVTGYSNVVPIGVAVIALLCCLVGFVCARHRYMNMAPSSSSSASTAPSSVGGSYELTPTGGPAHSGGLKIFLVAVDGVLKRFQMDREGQNKATGTGQLYDFNEPLLEALGEARFTCEKKHEDTVIVLLDTAEFKTISTRDRGWKRVVKQHKTKAGVNVDVEVYVDADKKSTWTDPTGLRMKAGGATWYELDYLDASNTKRFVYEQRNDSSPDKCVKKQGTPPDGFFKKAYHEAYALQLRLLWEGIDSVAVEGDGKISIADSVVDMLTTKYKGKLAAAEIVYVGLQGPFKNFEQDWDNAATDNDAVPDGSGIKYAKANASAHMTYEDLLKNLC